MFMRGTVPRGEIPVLLNISESSARGVMQELRRRGLVTSSSHKAPWNVALPMDIMPYYFPSLYRPELLGEQYLAMLHDQD